MVALFSLASNFAQWPVAVMEENRMSVPSLSLQAQHTATLFGVPSQDIE